MPDSGPSHSTKTLPLLVVGATFALLGIVAVLYVSWSASDKAETRRLLAPVKVEDEPSLESETVPAEVPAMQPTVPDNTEVVSAITTVEQQPEDEPPKIMGPRPVIAGSVDEFKAAFSNGTRDDKAHEVEGAIREIVHSEAVPGDIFVRASCRDAMCKVEVEWSPENEVAYHGLLIKLSQTFRPDLAIEPRGSENDRGAVPVDIYLPRQGYGTPSVPE